MVEVVSGRTPLRKAGARYSGRCPFHEERTPSFSVNPADKLYHCFGCGKGGDVITFVARDREPRLRRRGRVARRALPRHARVRGDLAAARGVAQAARPAARRARAGGVVLRAAPLGDGGRCAGARLPRGPRARRAGLPRVPARPLAGERARAEGAAEGLHARRAARRRADECARQRLLPAAADVPARRRARPRSSASRRASCTRTIRCGASTSTRPRASSSTSRRSSTASTSPGRRSRSRSAPSSSRATPT